MCAKYSLFGRERCPEIGIAPLLYINVQERTLIVQE